MTLGPTDPLRLLTELIRAIRRRPRPVSAWVGIRQNWGIALKMPATLRHTARTNRSPSWAVVRAAGPPRRPHGHGRGERRVGSRCSATRRSWRRWRRPKGSPTPARCSPPPQRRRTVRGRIIVGRKNARGYRPKTTAEERRLREARRGRCAARPEAVQAAPARRCLPRRPAVGLDARRSASGQPGCMGGPVRQAGEHEDPDGDGRARLSTRNRLTATPSCRAWPVPRTAGPPRAGRRRWRPAG